MLFHAVQRHGIELDNGQLTILRTAAFREQLRTETYRRICRSVFAALVDQRISAMVLKGAALAETVYSDPALRHSHDIEILLEDRHLKETADMLIPLGFSPAGTKSPRGLSGIEFTHASGLPLVLHRSLFQIPFYNSVQPAVLRRSRTTTIAEIPMRVLSPADALFHTCGHAAYSPSRASYRWISDAWLIIDRNPDLDWDVLLACAHRSRLTLPLSVMLHYLSEDLGAALPPTFLDRLFVTASKTDALGRELALFGARSAPQGGFKTLLRKTRGWRGRLFVIQWMLFPSRTYLLWLRQIHRPWLLPLCYVHRLVKYVVRRIRRDFKNSMRRNRVRQNHRTLPHASQNT
ncbi:MAG: nucleotidyltransferase family protein [Candidatus Binatia bacterium]